MSHRKLRIAWSVACGIAALLLLILWVRSYSHLDFCEIPTSGRSSIHLQTAHGLLVMFALNDYHDLRLGSIPTPSIILAGELTQPVVGVATSAGINLSSLSFDPARIHTTSLWPMFPGLCLLASVPWSPWWSRRFSLRTLLIATTLAAITLGLIIWFTR